MSIPMPTWVWSDSRILAHMVSISRSSRAHTDVHPTIAAGIHELAHALAIFRVRVACLHERDAGDLRCGPPQRARECGIKTQDFLVGFVAGDHDGNSIDDRLQNLLLMAELFLGAAARLLGTHALNTAPELAGDGNTETEFRVGESMASG
jgi:hypothetical protein